MQMFENNFVLWGWDITYESNRAKLQASVNNCLGPTAAMSLRNIPVERLPALVFIMKIRSSTEVFSVVHGKCFSLISLKLLLLCCFLYPYKIDRHTSSAFSLLSSLVLFTDIL